MLESAARAHLRCQNFGMISRLSMNKLIADSQSSAAVGRSKSAVRRFDYAGRAYSCEEGHWNLSSGIQGYHREDKPWGYQERRFEFQNRIKFRTRIRIERYGGRFHRENGERGLNAGARFMSRRIEQSDSARQKCAGDAIHRMHAHWVTDPSPE